MKVWHCGNFIDVTIGQRFLVARCGSGHTYFGEYATLKRTTKQHLVFITDSGAQVKTSIENLHKVVGKAAEYFVSPNIEGRDKDPNFIKSNVRFWDAKKLQLVTK